MQLIAVRRRLLLLVECCGVICIGFDDFWLLPSIKLAERQRFVAWGFICAAWSEDARWWTALRDYWNNPLDRRLAIGVGMLAATYMLIRFAAHVGHAHGWLS